MCYIGVTEGQIEKEVKMSICIFIFIYTINLSLEVYTKFENTGSNMRNLHQKFSLEIKKDEQI